MGLIAEAFVSQHRLLTWSVTNNNRNIAIMLSWLIKHRCTVQRWYGIKIAKKIWVILFLHFVFLFDSDCLFVSFSYLLNNEIRPMGHTLSALRLMPSCHSTQEFGSVQAMGSIIFDFCPNYLSFFTYTVKKGYHCQSCVQMNINTLSLFEAHLDHH